jgi:hypothetical protein
MEYVVVTTINPPTKLFDTITKRKDLTSVVIGDTKTPLDWFSPGINYLSIAEQEGLSYRINKLLPLAHYSRKNIGYVFASKAGATGIIDTDDDNYPTESWIYPTNSESMWIPPNSQGFINVYEHFTNDFLWPRGFPLDEILPSIGKTKDLNLIPNSEKLKVGIWQGLVDGEPDVDAIFRLTHQSRDISFSQKEPVILTKGNYCPLNSQNTYFIKQLFPLLYLPMTVDFRFTDILRGYIAQVIAQHLDFAVGFCSPNVVQIRNEHNFFKDFQDELSTYKYSKLTVEIAESTVSEGTSIANNLHNIYDALIKNKVVKSLELSALEAFLKDIAE